MWSIYNQKEPMTLYASSVVHSSCGDGERAGAFCCRPTSHELAIFPFLALLFLLLLLLSFFSRREVEVLKQQTGVTKNIYRKREEESVCVCEMEADEITVVLSRASELRSKITSCIGETTRRGRGGDEEVDGHDQSGSLYDGAVADDEAESLLSIRDALESLEEQLASLQALQQQQRYEREATLAEIDHSRKILLEKIKEYKGEDLEVIHEASAFASETVEHNDDLLLPPYPSHPPHSLVLDNGYPSSLSARHNLSRNGVRNDKPIHEARKNISELEQEHPQSPTRNSPMGLHNIVSVAAKTVLTLISVASILNFAGFEPCLKRSSKQFKFMHLFQKPTVNMKATLQCPPGKFLVMEDGEPRCLVKERVKIPFEAVVTTPDISYGCG